MTEQQACTLCGAGGHTADQCQWAKSERERFEAWQISSGFKRPDDPGEWEAWQARAALAQPSPALDRETPEIAGWMDDTGRPVKIGPSGRYHQPLMTISQHDRMALERWQYFRRKMQQMRDLMRGMRDRLTAAQARVAELEKQEPVAVIAKIPGTDWNSLDFHSDLQAMQVGAKLYANPVAQAGQAPEGWKISLIGPDEVVRIERADGKWCGVTDLSDSARDKLLYEMLKLLAAAPAQGGE